MSKRLKHTKRGKALNSEYAMTFQEIASELGITHQAVQMLLKRAIFKLQREFRKMGLITKN